MKDGGSWSEDIEMVLQKFIGVEQSPHVFGSTP